MAIVQRLAFPTNATSVTLRLPEVAHCLRRLRSESGKSYNRLEQDTGVTAAYIWRLENGERRNPTRDVLVLLALGMVLEREQLGALLETTNALLDSAGYAPLVRPTRQSDDQFPSVREEVAASARD